MDATRPTLRALREDLKIAIPPATTALEEIDHPLLAKANEQFADDNAQHERIRSIDDEVLFKVKIQRWRGAIWCEHSSPWLIAAGQREDGTTDDFYAVLETDAHAARARYNAEHRKALTTSTYVKHLLPNAADYERYQMEAGRRLLRNLSAVIIRLAQASLHDGREHTANLDTFQLGIQIRADDGNETYVAVRITGSVPDNIAFLILDLIPGCDRDAWLPEIHLPDRPLYGAEQAWSNIMEPEAAATLLDNEDS